MKFYAKCFILYVFIYGIFVLILKFLNNKNDLLSIGSSILQLGAKQQHNVTIITSYFILKKSKHRKREYKKWLKNLFQSVTAPLVIFTDKKSIDIELLKMREQYSTTLYLFDTHWNILKLIETKRNKSYLNDYKLKQKLLDPEKDQHIPDLYVIWNMKSFITSMAAKHNHYNSSVFMYSDAGAWRHGIIPEWPNQTFVLEIAQLIKNKVLVGQISNATSFDQDLIEGGFLMGNKLAIEKFNDNFWNLHDFLLENNIFIGKDQYLINMLTFKLQNQTIARLKCWTIRCNKFVDKWFYYQYFFANDLYYPCSYPKEQFLIL